MDRTFNIIDSPLGPITLVAEADELCGLYFDSHRHGPSPTQLGPRRVELLPAVTEQIDAYFARQRIDFDLQLVMRGTPFQQAVWTELQRIPFGTTTSYGELAKRVGRPRGARAVGAANARNPISLIVPCHRVVGASGNLAGYGGGIARKRALLDFERPATKATRTESRS